MKWLLCLMCFTTAGHAQSIYYEQVRGQLQAAGRFLEREGFVPVHDVWVGSLEQNAPHDVWFDGVANQEYVAVGVCDNDCTDADLEAFLADSLLDSDAKTDDVPVLRFTLPRAGEVMLRLWMYKCHNEPCIFGIALFIERLIPRKVEDGC